MTNAYRAGALHAAPWLRTLAIFLLYGPLFLVLPITLLGVFYTRAELLFNFAASYAIGLVLAATAAVLFKLFIDLNNKLGIYKGRFAGKLYGMLSSLAVGACLGSLSGPVTTDSFANWTLLMLCVLAGYYCGRKIVPDTPGKFATMLAMHKAMAATDGNLLIVKSKGALGKLLVALAMTFVGWLVMAIVRDGLFSDDMMNRLLALVLFICFPILIFSSFRAYLNWSRSLVVFNKTLGLVEKATPQQTTRLEFGTARYLRAQRVLIRTGRSAFEEYHGMLMGDRGEVYLPILRANTLVGFKYSARKLLKFFEIELVKSDDRVRVEDLQEQHGTY